MFTEQQLLDIVEQDGHNIQCAVNPSEKLQLAAVTQTGNAIQHITNPSERVQLAAVRQVGYAIKYIDNPSDKVKFAAVRRSPQAIGLIDNPCEELQMISVRANGFSLLFINAHTSLQVKLAAIRTHWLVIKYLPGAEPQLQQAAIECDPYAANFIC